MHWETADRKTRETALAVCGLVREAGGRAVLVGGCVRDALLGHVAPDVDLEVRGLAPGRLEPLLESRFPLDRTGRAFGVLKLRGVGVDVSIPRRESKAGRGHRGFVVDSDPDLDFRDAAARRDFTINAIAYDPLADEIIDPWKGRADLEARRLRHVSDHFAEDPLRVLRGMQFVARFGLTPDPATVALCRGLDLEGLARERIFEEWRKLLLWGTSISAGLSFLRETTWVRFFPELAAMIGCEQDPHWHPEGDVWTHVGMCLDVFAADRTGDPWEDLVVGLAVLCHDLGKPEKSYRAGDRIRSPGHAEAGEAPTRTLLARLTDQRALVEQVVPLVREHGHPSALYAARSGDAAVRRLARRAGRLDRLVRVSRADRLGRGPDGPQEFPEGDWLLERAGELDVRTAPPRPLVLGRHLLDLGLEPGPDFKEILDACYDAQVEGVFATAESGVDYARQLLRLRGSRPS